MPGLEPEKFAALSRLEGIRSHKDVGPSKTARTATATITIRPRGRRVRTGQGKAAGSVVPRSVVATKPYSRSWLALKNIGTPLGAELGLTSFSAP